MTRALPRLIVITDWAISDLEQRLEQLAELGPELAIQHRDPGAETRPFLERARRLNAICDRTGAQLFINGWVDIALLLKANVHLPEDAPDAKDVRHLIGPERFITFAFHEGTDRSRCEGADAAIVSPVFAPGSKPNDQRPPLGAEGFFRIARSLPIPAYALGGIDADRTVQLVRAALGLSGPLNPQPSTLNEFQPPPNGRHAFQGVAAISSVLRSPDPLSAARTLLHSL